MKTKFHMLWLGGFLFAVALPAQPAGPLAAGSAKGDYSSDIATVHDAQAQAIEQARLLLASGEGVRDRAALEAAIKEMEHAQSMLDDAKKSPEKLSAALAAEQSAYQALLKISPREYRMTRSRNGGQPGGSAGQAGERELSELDMKREANRYETEKQAATPQDARQREQSRVADRLKELAQRQQDLNGRLRELQTALQAARTEEERAEIQRQLKRLQDEQRQMLASVDELRQQLSGSPDAGSQADTQQQLDQTRSDMERAAQEMDRQSPSDALAAGTRAQEKMQNLREDLRKQTSSGFSEQMRQLRNQARDLTKQEEEIARGLDSLNNGGHQTLDNSAERQQIAQQMAAQQSALTNLLSQMRDTTEQAETTEPLLSKQLYDTLRRADQMHTENSLELGRQLTQRGFLREASQVERTTRTNLSELASSIERAANSVLGSEADALRYAQKELDDLTRQMERELGGAGTNAAGIGTGTDNRQSQSNRLAGATANTRSGFGTNSLLAGANSGSADSASQPDQNGSPAGDSGNPANAGQNGSRSETANGNNTQESSAGDGQQGQAQAANGNNQGNGNQPGENGGQDGNTQGGARPRASGDRLRQFAVQLGADGGGGGGGGPITGGDYLNWSGRLRDVEEAVEPPDLRNQLATVRERVSALRADFRQRGRKPDTNVVREQIVTPMAQVRVWLQEELARREKSESLVPLDRDPVPDNYTELVREYYEKLGSAR